MNRVLTALNPIRLAAGLASALGAAAIGLAVPAGVAAQAPWPERPIRVVLPFPPGGPSDIVMRVAAEKMQATLKTNIVVENKPGAGGNIGSADVSRAAPDGYTWLWEPIRWSRSIRTSTGSSRSRSTICSRSRSARASTRPWSATRRSA